MNSVAVHIVAAFEVCLEACVWFNASKKVGEFDFQKIILHHIIKAYDLSVDFINFFIHL